jgi:hypothetical protein
MKAKGVIKKTGDCLCGAVRIIATNPNNTVCACHCEMCRKWGGGPFMEIDCGSEVLFEGEENVAIYDSSKWAERGFCNQCGTHLFYRLKENKQHMITIGIFNNQDNLIFEKQVFIDRKPSFYCFSNKTNDVTEAEMFEMYGSS